MHIANFSGHNGIDIDIDPRCVVEPDPRDGLKGDPVGERGEEPGSESQEGQHPHYFDLVLQRLGVRTGGEHPDADGLGLGVGVAAVNVVSLSLQLENDVFFFPVGS